jgi:hypothetical protein
MGSRPHSTRRQAWHVQPVSEDTGKPMYTSTGNRQTILCGHLFNAGAERSALGIGVGGGEECCITLEPIADARLPFSDNIRVSHLQPNLTGVQLLCGHRFSATNLLWHWCISPMVCPMCRAKYSYRGSTASAATPTSSAVDNFPPLHCRLLRGILVEHARDRAVELERENRAEVVHAVMTDVLDTVFTSEPNFYLMLSFVGNGMPAIYHSIRLHRSTTDEEVLGENALRFSLQRASTRYISAIMNTADKLSRISGESFRMKATVMVGIDNAEPGCELMLPVANFNDHIIPLDTDESAVVVTPETHELATEVESSAVAATTIPISPLPRRTVVCVKSVDSNSEIQLEYFRYNMPTSGTLVSVAISLQACTVLNLVAQQLVQHPHAIQFERHV